MGTPGMAALLAAHLTLTASGPPSLARAEEALANLDYETASGALEQALATPNLDRATLLHTLELAGGVQATLGHKKKADELFRELLALDPEHEPQAQWSPRVKTPFFAAKTWVFDHQPLKFKKTPAQVASSAVQQVGVELASDPLHLAAKVRLSIQEDGAAARVVERALTAPGTVAEATHGAEVRYWAELLGARGEQLALVGSSSQPEVEKIPAPAVAVAPAPAPPPAPAPALTPPVSTPAPAVAETAPEGPRLRPLAYGLAGGGALALGVGAFFGLQTRSAVGQIDGAHTDGAGNTVGMTQAQAAQLDATARRDAVLANVLFAAGAVGLASGVGVWIWGSQVSAAPAPGGVAVAATLP